MNYILAGIEEDRFLRNMIIRVFCEDYVAFKRGILFAVNVIEEAQNLKIIPCYVDKIEKVNMDDSLPLLISFSILYKDEYAREQFLDIVKKYSASLNL